MSEIPEDFALVPPAPERVAARALVLAAVSCRALLEKDSSKPWAELFNQQIHPWLERMNIAGEVEPAELAIIKTPLGKLDKKIRHDAAAQSEGMVVLAWALGRSPLPSLYNDCDPSEVASALGFLDERPKTPLEAPNLRDAAEIERWANAYLAVAWRLRHFKLLPYRIDFVAYAATCEWGPLRLDDIEIEDKDLNINGRPIEKADAAAFQKALSIAAERHRAFDWLLGFNPIYSQVARDT